MPVPEIHDLSGRTFFVTGGTGAVGRTLIDYFDLCYRTYGGFGVVVLTRDAEAFAVKYPLQARHPWLSFAVGNLVDLQTLPKGVTDVIHGAADTHLNIGHAAWVDQIVGGTHALLTASAKAAVERFLLISSGAIYGPQPTTVTHLNEEYAGAPDPLLVSSTYGQSKRMAEQLCAIFCHEHGLGSVIARLFAFGSVHVPRDGRYALGSFIQDALADNVAPICVAGDGTAVRSYLGARDMAHALVTALSSGVPGVAYNVGSDVAVTIGDLAHAVRDRLSPKREILVLGTPGNHQRSLYVPSVARIAALGAATATELTTVIDDAAGVVCTRT